MPNSNRRDFLKSVGQGALAAGVSMGLPGKAMADDIDPRTLKAAEEANQASTWPYPVQYGKETEVDVDVVVVGEVSRAVGRRLARLGKD